MQVGRCSARLKIARARGQPLPRRRTLRGCGKRAGRGAGGQGDPRPPCAHSGPLHGASPRGRGRRAPGEDAGASRASSDGPGASGTRAVKPNPAWDLRIPPARRGERGGTGPGEALVPGLLRICSGEGTAWLGISGWPHLLLHLPAGGESTARLAAPPTWVRGFPQPLTRLTLFFPPSSAPRHLSSVSLTPFEFEFAGSLSLALGTQGLKRGQTALKTCLFAWTRLWCGVKRGAGSESCFLYYYPGRSPSSQPRAPRI